MRTKSLIGATLARIEGFTNQASRVHKAVQRTRLCPRLFNRQLFLDERKSLEVSLRKFLRENPNPNLETIDNALSSIWKIPSNLEKKSPEKQIAIVRKQIRRINDAFDVLKKLNIENPKIKFAFIYVLHSMYQSLINSNAETKPSYEDALNFVRKTGFTVNPKIENYLEKKSIGGIDLSKLDVNHFFIPAKLYEESIEKESKDYNALKSFLEAIFGNFDMKVPPMVESDLGIDPGREIHAYENGTYIVLNSAVIDSSVITRNKGDLDKVEDSEFKKQLAAEIDRTRTTLLQHELTHYFLRKKTPTISSIATEIIARTMEITVVPHLAIARLLTADSQYVGPIKDMLASYLHQALIAQKAFINCPQTDPISISNAIYKALGKEAYDELIRKFQGDLLPISKRLVDQARA